MPRGKDGNLIESSLREFELDHWHRLVDMGAKNTWVKVDPPEELSSDSVVSKLDDTPKTVKEENTISDTPQLSGLQVELAQAQIDLNKAQTILAAEQTKDLKFKYLYFIIGIVLGNLGTVLLWIQWLSRPEVSSNVP